MGWNEREDNIIYKVVMNHDEQYSIWPADRENPLGWTDVPPGDSDDPTRNPDFYDPTFDYLNEIGFSNI